MRGYLETARAPLALLGDRLAELANLKAATNGQAADAGAVREGLPGLRIEADVAVDLGRVASEAAERVARDERASRRHKLRTAGLAQAAGGKARAARAHYEGQIRAKRPTYGGSGTTG